MSEREISTIAQIRRVFRDTRANLDLLVGLRDGALAYATDETILYRQNGDGAANWEAITTLSQFNAVNTQVFSGASPNPIAWTDLDVSAVVGEKVSFVILRCYNADAAARYFFFRPDGETEWSVVATGGMLNFMTCHVGATDFGVAACFTSALGVLEWSYNMPDEAGVTIDVIGWI